MNSIYICFDYKGLYYLKISGKPSHTNKIHIHFSLMILKFPVIEKLMHKVQCILW